MKSVPQVIEAVASGDKKAAAELLPLLYKELRRLAVVRMAKLPPGNTLQPTALVHDAYLRLVGDQDPGWDGRGHFFASAAEAMRQLLVEQARRKAAVKHGGGQKRMDVDKVEIAVDLRIGEILAVDQAIDRMRASDPRKADIILHRYFAGLSREETAAVIGVSVRTIDREWRSIVARLHRDLHGDLPLATEPDDANT
ncbi:MAG: RNA polymerase subunit sigma [Verrucomicrobia bacterium]|nr:MAG: RNA polymerase subunit sigma [Verrucomicrobiota bacterium]